jgi:excisionase family DNA binding protein
MVDSAMTNEDLNGRSLTEYARMCKVARMTSYRWFKRGLLKAIRVGGRLRVPEAEFAKLEREGPPVISRIAARPARASRRKSQVARRGK